MMEREQSAATEEPKGDALSDAMIAAASRLFGATAPPEKMEALRTELARVRESKRKATPTTEKTAFDLDVERDMDNPEYRAAYMAARGDD